jgi:hypothetical protein
MKNTNRQGEGVVEFADRGAVPQKVSGTEIFSEKLSVPDFSGGSRSS